ncbi:hypothetical protein OG225_19805 [Nocardia sp. NBC_01377]
MPSRSSIGGSHPEALVGFRGMFTSNRRPSQFGGVPLRFPPPEPISPIGEIYMATTTVDIRGRLGERSAIKVLHWEPGQPLTLSAEPGRVVVVAEPTGRWTIGASGYLSLPARLRRESHIGLTDRVLLLAAPDNDVLAVYSTAYVADALACRHPDLRAPKP